MPPVAQAAVDPARGKFALHGPAVEITCGVPALAGEVRRLFEPFAVAGWPEGTLPTSGTVRPFDPAEVLRHVSPAARRLTELPERMELYQDDERFWLVDERWGMVELNMVRGHFRSWVFPNARLDPAVCAEVAVVWPLAQLLRGKGLHLLPAVSAVRDGWAVLILCPFALEAELVALICAGYKIIGQRWTAVREEDGRLALMHLPGRVERAGIPRSRASQEGGACGSWVDLTDEHVRSRQSHAFCDVVLVADGSRHATALGRQLHPDGAALDLLRGAWPMPELHPQHGHAEVAVKLVRHTRVCELQLSRRPQDLLAVLDTLHRTSPWHPAGSTAPAAPLKAPSKPAGGRGQEVELLRPRSAA